MRIKFRIREVKQSDITVFYAEKLKILINKKSEWVDIAHDTDTGVQTFLSYIDAFKAAKDYRQKILEKLPNDIIYELKALEIDTDLPEEEPLKEKTPDEILASRTPEEKIKIAEILKNKLTDNNKISNLNNEIYSNPLAIYSNPLINERIVEAHSYVNNILTKVELFRNSNNTAIRLFVFWKLKEKIGNIEIICDETNNTPEVINNNIVIARVMWIDNNIHKYQDLFFGEERNITKFLLNHMEYRNNENIF